MANPATLQGFLDLGHLARGGIFIAILVGMGIMLAFDKASSR